MSEQSSLDDVAVTPVPVAVDAGGDTSPDTYTNLVEDSYQRDESQADTVVITALNLDLTQAILPANKHLIIFADTITIKTSLWLPGRNMTLYARQVVSQTGGIDLSAPAIPAGIGNYTTGDRARDGGPGANRGDKGSRGADGASGAAGGRGGDLAIYADSLYGALALQSRGAAGGRGQNGGNGGAGQQGVDGEDAHIAGAPDDQRVDRGPNPGGKGGDGGIGGIGGRGGAGGAGGKITLGIIRSAGTVTVNVAGGAAGSGGTGGAGGGSGSGGTGGRFAECRSGGKYPMTYRICNHTTNRAGGGTQGSNGPNGITQGDGTAGANGTSSALTERPAIRAFFLNDLKLSYRTLVLRQAEMSYMNGDYRMAAKFSEWLRFVCPDSDASAKQVRFRADVLLTQLHQGLNYYGRLAHHVPLVTIEYYRGLLTSLLLLGQNIENARNTYNSQQATRESRLGAIDQAIAESAKLQAKLQESLGQLQNQENQLQSDILQQVTARSKQRDVMMAAAAAFKNAVTAKAQGCSFEDLLKFVTTVVSVGKAVYGDYTAISTAVGGLKNMTTTIESLQNAIKHLQTIQKSVSDIAKQWQTVKAELSDATPDVSKIVAEQEEFDAMIKPYLDMPEAQAYKKHVHDYLGIVQAVNKKLLDYNSTVIARIGMTLQIAQRESEIADIRNRRAQNFDPTAQHFRSYMAGAYEDIRKHILRYLFEEHTAYRYWALEEKPFLVQDRSMAGLSALHAKLMGDILDLLNNRVAVMQPFQQQTLTLAEASRSGQFAAFRQGYDERKEDGTQRRVHELTFSISPEDGLFQGWVQVLATNFTIALPGVRTANAAGTVSVQLIHSGSSVIYGQNGKPMEFSHARRLADYSYRIADGVRVGGGSLGGDGDNREYIGLSPYATWTIRLRSDATSNPGLDLSAVREIQLTFSGKYFPSLRAKVEQAAAEPATIEEVAVEGTAEEA